MSYTLPSGIKPGKLVISNMDSPGDTTQVLQLKAWEARIYKQ
jgi:hypothetical protein